MNINLKNLKAQMMPPNHCSFNNCYNWGNKTNDEIILDECKWKTAKHRSKTSIYEFLSKLSTVEYSTGHENKGRYFRPICCTNNSRKWVENGNLNFYFKNNSENRENTKDFLWRMRIMWLISFQKIIVNIRFRSLWYRLHSMRVIRKL